MARPWAHGVKIPLSLPFSSALADLPSTSLTSPVSPRQGEQKKRSLADEHRKQGWDFSDIFTFYFISRLSAFLHTLALHDSMVRQVVAASIL